MKKVIHVPRSLLLANKKSGGGLPLGSVKINEFFDACRENHIDPLEQRDISGASSILINAVISGNMDAIQVCLERIKSLENRDDWLNITSIYGGPLYIAAQSKNPELVAALIDFGFDPNSEDKKKMEFPLEIAIKKSNGLVVEKLIEKGADPFLLLKDESDNFQKAINLSSEISVVAPLISYVEEIIRNLIPEQALEKSFYENINRYVDIIEDSIKAKVHTYQAALETHSADPTHINTVLDDLTGYLKRIEEIKQQPGLLRSRSGSQDSGNTTVESRPSTPSNDY